MLNRGKILVVDNDPGDAFFIKDVLTPLGYEVFTTDNVEKAIRLAKRLDPDVILLDSVTPNIDTIEVARRLKSNRKTSIIPLVMAAISNDVENRLRALEAGVDEFLVKPVERIELVARIRSQVKVKDYQGRQRDQQKSLQGEVAKKTKQLEYAFQQINQAVLDTVYRLGRAAEFKDEETGAHVQRIGHMSALLAKHMGLDEKMTQAIFYAAPLHDVGKIGIPDRILLKEGPLTPEEWVIMKEHTIIGGRILEDSSIENIQIAKDIALTHHEHWDGSGYPYGLKKEQIPLMGRIVAVVDVFDALRSSRPYKDKFSFGESVSIIQENKGKQFDPDVVDVFSSVRPQVLRIDQQFRRNFASSGWKGYQYDSEIILAR